MPAASQQIQEKGSEMMDKAGQMKEKIKEKAQDVSDKFTSGKDEGKDQQKGGEGYIQ